MAEVDTITGYHAHVYYLPQTRERAARVRDAIGAAFDVTLGRWHDGPVGPHPMPSYQVAFAPAAFATLVPWLALNREGLSVLVHPESGDEVADHTEHAMWLGPALPLDVEYLRAVVERHR
ncbi:MAG: DOPA 4,5-dioxygenase family protein [Ectothiorhodospiraceae bacterium]|nr:DOPA 4,5-dioxygenase family protein [Ectothiorhodospiraceae bacterium]